MSCLSNVGPGHCQNPGYITEPEPIPNASRYRCSKYIGPKAKDLGRRPEALLRAPFQPYSQESLRKAYIYSRI